MLRDKIIINEPFIWAFSINKEKTVIQISKVTHQQLFLIGDTPEALAKYYQKINKVEVKKIDNKSRTSPFTQLGGMDLLLVNLN